MFDRLYGRHLLDRRNQVQTHRRVIYVVKSGVASFTVQSYGIGRSDIYQQGCWRRVKESVSSVFTRLSENCPSFPDELQL